MIGFVRRLRARAPAWVWLISLASVCGVVPVILAFTDHDRCILSDPLCVFHTYTLVQAAGPWILGLVAAPLAMSLLLARVLHSKTTHGGRRADRAALVLMVLDCLICLAGMLVAGLTMLPPAVFTVCAVAIAPFPPNRTDRLNRPGGSVFAQPRSEPRNDR